MSARRAWRATRTKYEATLKGRLGWQGLKADEYVSEGPYVVSSAHFDAFAVHWDLCPRVSEERYALDANIQLRVHDVLLMKDGAAMGKLAYVTRMPGPACLNSHVLLVRPQRQDSFAPRFMFYVMCGKQFQEFVRTNGTGATFLGISQEAIGNYSLALPCLDAQRAIADFLDRKTAAIDALIEKKQKLLDLLAEKRAALINQAVTKGLDPDVPMKDSGIPWIGEIPAHWTLLPLRRLVARIEQGWSPVADDRVAEEGEWAVLKLSAISKGRFRPAEHKVISPESRPRPSIAVQKGDLLLTRANTPQLVGDTCVVDSDASRLMLSDLIYRLALAEDESAIYLSLFLRSATGRASIAADARGSSQSMVKVSQSHIKAWPVPRPPIGEQRSIADWITKHETELTSVENVLEIEIQRLQEYRQALITAAVTGQLPVPEEPAGE